MIFNVMLLLPWEVIMEMGHSFADYHNLIYSMINSTSQFILD